MLVNDFSLIESGFTLITAQLLSASVYELLGTKQLFAVIVISLPLIVNIIWFLLQNWQFSDLVVYCIFYFLKIFYARTQEFQCNHLIIITSLYFHKSYLRSEYRVVFQGKVVVTYFWWFSFSTSSSAFFGSRKTWISSQFCCGRCPVIHYI